MSRRTLLLATMALATLTVSGSAEEGKATPKSAGKGSPYVHAVIFTMASGAPAGAAAEVLADCHELLAKIPSVRLLKAGPAAEKAPPPAKSDYSVGLMILFDDVDGCKEYIDHPLHKKFVEKNGKYFDREKLAVYDFVDAKK